MTRIFEDCKYEAGNLCPLCNTGDQGDSVLVPIVGTNDEEGSKIFEAKLVHHECLLKNMWYYPESNVIVSGG